MKTDRIMIAVPCMDQVAAEFMASMAMLNKPAECTLNVKKGSLIYQSRNELAKEAIKGGFDYIMWFDSDMMFQPDTLTRLYTQAKEKNLGVISGIYYRRTPPFKPVLFKTLDCEGGRWTGYDDYPENGLFKVAGMGFGCVLTDIQTFFDVKAAHTASWFTPFQGFGEDLAYCQRVRDAGYDIYVDPTIKCGHIGHLIIDEAYFKAYKEDPSWQENA